MRLNWIVFYNVLILRLTLGIGNLMSSHSPSAGHVPLGTGRDKGRSSHPYLIISDQNNAPKY